jgi:EpsI family protein
MRWVCWSATGQADNHDADDKFLGPHVPRRSAARRRQPLSAFEPFLDLFLAFFPSQRAGSTIHSPQNCLPGAGWLPVESGKIKLLRPDGKTITVNRYLIGKGLERRLVLYWYQAHGRVVASEYWAKFYLVTDAIRMNRSDGALIRVTTPVAQNESSVSAEQRGVAFIQDVLPFLGRYIPD